MPGDYSERLFNKSLAGTDLKFPYLSPTTNSSLLAALVSTSFRKAFFKPCKTFSDNSEISVLLLSIILALLDDYTPNIVTFYHFFRIYPALSYYN